jgi:hypothetical protein
MFVERKVCYSALFTNLVGWHTGAVSFPLSDVILAQLACPLSDMFRLHSGITDLCLYKHWVRSLPLEWSLIRYSTRVSSSLACKKVVVTDIDKPSGL